MRIGFIGSGRMASALLEGILRAEIAHTVSSVEEVEEEIRLLFASFGP